MFNLNDMMAERPLRFGEASTTGWDYFDYAPGQPNLFLLSRFKQLLVKEYGIEKGFEIYRQTVVRHRDASLKLRRLESHHDFSKAHATCCREFFSAGRPYAIMPPRVIGEGNHRPLSGLTRSFYISCLKNALVRGRSSIVVTGDVALADFQGEELSRIDDEIEFDAAVFHRNGDQAWTIDLQKPAVEFDEAFSLLGCRTDFFGDWLGDMLQRYVAATDDERLATMTILIDAHMPKTHRQSLEMMRVGGARIVEIEAFQSAVVRRLWWACGIGYMPFHQVLNDRFKWDDVACHPRDSLLIGQEMQRRANLVEPPTSGPTRVFLARKDFRHRKMVNAEDIKTIASSFGFTIVYAEELDFADQARLLRRARYIVAPEGSSLFLTIFLGDGAKLCILSHRQTEGAVLYNGDGDESGSGLTIITGPEAGERHGRSQDMDYSIDVEGFRRFLAEWLGSNPQDVDSSRLP